MALNLASFRTRALTSAVFVVVMVAGVTWSAWSFFCLFSAIHFGCWVEYQKLASLSRVDYCNISAIHRYSVMLSGWCAMWYFMDATVHVDLRQASLVSGIGLLVVAIIADVVTRKFSTSNLWLSLTGLLYISLGCASMMGLYHLGQTPEAISDTHNSYTELHSTKMNLPWILPAVVIACMWTSDTMAYLVGSLIGKTPLSAISPRKTWEGTVGGIILCIAIVGSLLCFTGLRSLPAIARLPAFHWFIIAGIAAVAGTFGDLFESKLKRSAGVKDSGNVLPGHGGFLDRFDSLLLAAPIVLLYLLLVLS